MDVTAAGAARQTPGTASVLRTVVVHPWGALATRGARLELPAGFAGAVRVEGLSPVLHEHSLRGRVVAGPPGLRVADVRLDPRVLLRRADELPGLRLDLEDAEDRRTTVADRCDRLRAETAEVAGFRAEPPQPRRGEPPRRAPVESILALAAFVDSRLADLHERLRAAEEELAAADHHVEELAHRLERASTAERTERSAPSLAAVLTLTRDADAAPEGEAHEPEAEAVELEVEYQVPGATWSPVYQLSLDAGGGRLVLRARVAQRTGEDWTGVRLGLSTADLERRADLPEPRSLRIGRARPPETRGWRPPPTGLDELFADYDAAVAVPPAEPVRPGPRSAPAAPDDGGRAEGAGAAGPAPSHPALLPAPGGPPPAAARVRAAAPPDASDAPGRQPAPLAPPKDLLDYARLTLAGPDAPEGRGTLRPAEDRPDAVVAEYRGLADAVALPPRPPHAVDVRESAGSFAYRFDTAAPADVAADGAWHTVTIREVATRTKAAYVCVPEVDESVYGTVLVTNASAHPLPAGPADVVVDGDYVLTAALPTLAPGERQEVGIGVVESIRVARRERTHESAAGLRGGTTVLDHIVEVELANRLPHPVVVEVRERDPGLRRQGGPDRGAPRVAALDRARPAVRRPGRRLRARGARPPGRAGTGPQRHAHRRIRDPPARGQGADRRRPEVPAMTDPVTGEAPLPLPITAVTCLEDRAQVERSGTVLLAPGVRRLRVGPVTALAVDRSLRAELVPDDGEPAFAHVVDARVVRARTAAPGTPGPDAVRLRRETQALEREIDAARRLRQRLDSRLAVIAQAKADLHRDIVQGAGAGDADPERWADRLDRVDEAAAPHLEEVHRLRRRLHDLAEELAEVREALALTEGEAGRPTAYVDLDRGGRAGRYRPSWPSAT